MKSAFVVSLIRRYRVSIAKRVLVATTSVCAFFSVGFLCAGKIKTTQAEAWLLDRAGICGRRPRFRKRIAMAARTDAA